MRNPRPRRSRPNLDRARGITKDGKPIFSETIEHQKVAQWLDENGVYFIHVPNEGKRTPWTGRTLKRMGMKAGVADFLIFDPPPNYPGSGGVALEIKALDGGKPTPAQVEFLGQMGLRNYRVRWYKGSEAAIAWLKECGYEKAKP